ncbi:DMT family transporter [Brevibacillus fulvus]|uniref:Paired small multidrug resistance pump n=1 Tax=Brevibacillus fulvus TaxID=1125967 RepID=A0A939BUC0_9BACL|nr:multidrug efflux SMR transporter [Brevibacillus fulvus]MBM7589381.1 paired small multidrug resistance pump [Brevibacillus fulvus]
MDWLFLVLAGCMEMFAVTMMNKWHADRKWLSFLLLLLGFGGSFLFLDLAMETLPMGTAYAVWTGIGAAGAAITGMLFYREPKDWKRIVFIAMILVSAIGLKLIS